MPIDPRIINIGIDISGVVYNYTDLAIIAQGSKFTSATQNEATIKIANLDKVTRDFLATEGSPFNKAGSRPRQQIFVEAGRVSTGLSRIFLGDITGVTLTQPPEIWTVIKAMTTQYLKGTVIATNEPATASLSQISQKAASSMGLSLNFLADDKEIANYGYSGAVEKQVNKIIELADVDVFVDDEKFIVKNRNEPAVGKK